MDVGLWGRPKASKRGGLRAWDIYKIYRPINIVEGKEIVEIIAHYRMV
jgi:hypothetical protein